MTTAREQARDAAKNHVYDVMAHGGYTGPEPAADAASDVWEPIVQDLAEALGWLVDDPTPYDAATSRGQARKRLERAREALG